MNIAAISGVHNANEKQIPSFTTHSTKETIHEGWAFAKNCALRAFDKIYTVSHSIFSSINYITSDANVIASVCRKLDKQVVRSVEYIVTTAGSLTTLRQSLRTMVGFVDSAQVLADADYFYNQKYKNDTVTVVSSKILLTASDITGALLWLEEMSLFSLSKLSSSIANIKVFSFVPKVASIFTNVSPMAGASVLGRAASWIGEIRMFKFIGALSISVICLRTLTLAYICCAIDALQRLIASNNRIETTQASLDLAAYLSELTLDAIVSLGIANLAVVGSAGAAAIGLVLASFLYKKYNVEKPRYNKQN